jgi:hypothetical protein
MSVYEDHSWEITDKSGSYRFQALNRVDSDEWRTCIEKALKIQKKTENFEEISKLAFDFLFLNYFI